MKVLKFGGTSVGTPDAIRNVLDIVKKEADDDQLVVVVSAFSGVTNQLADLPHKALERFEEAELLINELLLKHQHAYEELVGEKESATIDGMIRKLIDVCRGINLLQEITEKSRDFIMTMGELLSSHIIFHFFKKHIETTFFNSKDFLIVQDGNHRKRADLEASALRINELNGLKKVNIFPGFIAATTDGTITSLGRGGSDYTASLLANLFDASSLEIWSDVDGIMSADPKYVKQAKALQHISYEEALEISHFGAKVIYPPSIQPTLTKGIPITIKNTFHPEKEGTLITKEWDQNKTIIQGISSIKNIATINLSGSGMVGIPSFSARFFKALANQQVNIIMITQASSEHSICVAISGDELDRALNALEEAFHAELSSQAIDPIEVDEASAIVALVGANMRNQVGVSGKMFNTLGKNGISIQAIAQGSSERNISAVIPRKDLKKALNTLHESFFLSERKRVNLFIIGVGNVGGTFLEQVKAQTDYLISQFGMRISIAGIANSKKMLLDEQGVDLENWQTDLSAGQPFQPGIFINQMKAMNLRNSIFIDITASHEIPALYKDALCCNISVVTPNKVGTSGPYVRYKELQEISHRNNAQYLFETIYLECPPS
ncbi:MAG: aspartate kinase, partial [Bacteroidota bacterium]